VEGETLTDGEPLETAGALGRVLDAAPSAHAGLNDASPLTGPQTARHATMISAAASANRHKHHISALKRCANFIN